MNVAYEEKQCSGKASEKAMLTLLWDVDEVKRLYEKDRRLFVDVTAALDMVCGPIAAQCARNLPQKLMSIRTQFCELTRGVYHFKRVPASHIFCLMIST